MANTKKILLTGAGFTHNFGAPLAANIWSIIFSDIEIQKANKLREVLVNDEDFDYEGIFHAVINDNSYNEEDKATITASMERAYLHIDNLVRNSPLNSTASQVEEHIIKRFKGSFIFTLNQDLFVERLLKKYHPDYELPGVPSKILSKPIDESRFNEFNNDQDITIIENKEFTEWDKIKNTNKIKYVKLHGSFDWHDKQNNSLMVIGRDKEDQLKRHPLLRSYINKFNEVLNKDNVKILIIGYGFNDKHINKALASAQNLGVYIIDPNGPKKWFAKMKNKGEYGDEIISKVRGYFPMTLSTIFPDNNLSQNNTVYWQAVKSAFFD